MHSEGLVTQKQGVASTRGSETRNTPQPPRRTAMSTAPSPSFSDAGDAKRPGEDSVNATPAKKPRVRPPRKPKPKTGEAGGKAGEEEEEENLEEGTLGKEDSNEQYRAHLGCVAPPRRVPRANRSCAPTVAGRCFSRRLSLGCDPCVS